MKKIINRIFGRIRHLKHKKAIAAESIEDRFSNIYTHKLWFRNKQSRSGAGSTLEATTQLRSFLPKFLKECKAKNIMDLGCGDFHWMKEVKLPCNYIGLDIVRSVIEENKNKYADDNHHFYHHNAVEDPLPEGADVILCREVLFHLSFEDGIQVIKNILKSGARYLLVTTSDTVQENKDIRTGRFRNINIQLSPYLFPVYASRVEDNAISQDRIMGIWKIEDLSKSIRY